MVVAYEDKNGSIKYGRFITAFEGWEKVNWKYLRYGKCFVFFFLAMFWIFVSPPRRSHQGVPIYRPLNLSVPYCGGVRVVQFNSYHTERD